MNNQRLNNLSKMVNCTFPFVRVKIRFLACCETDCFHLGKLRAKSFRWINDNRRRIISANIIRCWLILAFWWIVEEIRHPHIRWHFESIWWNNTISLQCRNRALQLHQHLEIFGFHHSIHSFIVLTNTVRHMVTQLYNHVFFNTSIVDSSGISWNPSIKCRVCGRPSKFCCLICSANKIDVRMTSMLFAIFQFFDVFYQQISMMR